MFHVAAVLAVLGLAWFGLDAAHARPSVGAARYANEVLAVVIAFVVGNALWLLKE